MKKESWKKKIKKACEDAGTYRQYFNSIIDTLAGLMEIRDDAQRQFNESGGLAVIMHTNKAGATNIVKNPALIVIMDCNAQALAYWRDLGLTPAGLKKINEAAIKEKPKSGLAEVLKDLGG